MSGTGFWERFALDPRREDNAGLRAADRDRDLVHELLASAYAEGRLTREEHDERTGRAAAARTLGELPDLVVDLVPVVPAQRVASARPLRAEAELRYRQRRQRALVAFLTPTLICWVVWVAVLLGGVGTAFPWPAIVMIATGARYVQLATSHRDTVASIERNLERKELRRLEVQRRLQGLRLPFPPPPERPGRSDGGVNRG